MVATLVADSTKLAVSYVFLNPIKRCVISASVSSPSVKIGLLIFWIIKVQKHYSNSNPVSYFQLIIDPTYPVCHDFIKMLQAFSCFWGSHIMFRSVECI